MFELEHHRNVALVLQALEPRMFLDAKCYFGGGTAMALRYGEYRESVDIDFLVSDAEGYRRLRQLLGERDLNPLLREGLSLPLARPVIADRYGIRTVVRAGRSAIKFEIVSEGRIALEPPGDADVVCGIPTLTALDLAASKLLANADRWADDAVFSRDLIDLAMQRGSAALLRRACAKAERAYGTSVRTNLSKAVEALRRRPLRLDACMRALSVRGVSKAQLWQGIRRVEKVLAMPTEAVNDPAFDRRKLVLRLRQVKLAPVRSSAVQKLGYDPPTRMAAVQYKGSDVVYGYPHLTPEEVVGWLEVMEDHRSIGEYIAKVIKANHDFEHVRSDEPD